MERLDMLPPHDMTPADAEDFFDEFAFKMFERYAASIPSERKLEIALQLIKKAVDAGAESAEDCCYFLDGEFEFLLAIMGKRMPIRLDEFADALTAVVLSRGQISFDDSSHKPIPPRW
jgi:hypothetical protein